jgi:hypothetical protein
MKPTRKRGRKSGGGMGEGAKRVSVWCHSPMLIATTSADVGWVGVPATTPPTTSKSSAPAATDSNTKTVRRTCTIPWVPPSGSRLVRMHWTAQRELVEVAGVYLVHGFGQNWTANWHPNPPPDFITVTIQMYRKRALDTENAWFACKPIFDALVRLGWAKDDSPKHMNQVVLPVIVDTRAKPKTEITIEWSESDHAEAK